MHRNGRKRVDPKVPTYINLADPEICTVCEATASGYHYGIMACEGCKAFFRRSIQNKRWFSYICHKGHSCTINEESRNRCKLCRFQNCLQVGMIPAMVLKNSTENEQCNDERSTEPSSSRKHKYSEMFMDNDSEKSTQTEEVSNAQPRNEILLDNLKEIHRKYFLEIIRPDEESVWHSIGCKTQHHVLQLIEPSFHRVFCYLEEVSSKLQLGLTTICSVDCIDILVFRAIIRWTSSEKLPMLADFLNREMKSSEKEDAITGFFPDFFNLILQLKNLDLDETEIGLCYAIVACGPGENSFRASSSSQNKAWNILKEQVYSALFHHLMVRKDHKLPISRFHEVMKKIDIFHKFSQMYFMKLIKLPFEIQPLSQRDVSVWYILCNEGLSESSCRDASTRNHFEIHIAESLMELSLIVRSSC